LVPLRLKKDSEAIRKSIDEENKKILFHTPLDSYLSNDVISEISIYEFE